MKDHTKVLVDTLPKCTFCDREAWVDGKTIVGPWATLCREHYEVYGIGLGLGKGQRLILKTKEGKSS